MHAAGPPDDPDESTERIIDATEDGDYTAVSKYAPARDVDSAADTKTVTP